MAADPGLRRLLLIGSVGCGKTTLMQRLLGLDQVYSKTQAVAGQAGIWDTPGEFIDTMWLKPALRQTSTNAELVVFLQAATVATAKIPPGFRSFFIQPVIGVVTKIDLATPDQIDHARHLLSLAGARPIFQVDSLSGHGWDDLLPALRRPDCADPTGPIRRPVGDPAA